MAEEIFAEIEEDLHKEKLKKLWRDYGKYLISLVLIIVLSVGGWQIFKYWKLKTLEQASNTFFSFVKSSAENAENAFDSINKIDQLPGGYNILANFKKADLNYKLGNEKNSIEIFYIISNDNSIGDSYKNLSLFMSLLREDPSEKLIDIIDKNLLKKRSFNLNLLELKISTLLSLGKKNEALIILDEMSNFLEINENMKQRLNMIKYSIGNL